MENTFNKFTRKSDDLNDILFPVQFVENPLIALGYDVNKLEAMQVIADLGNGKPTTLRSMSEGYGFTPNSAIYPYLEQLFSANKDTRNFTREVTNNSNLSFAVRYSFPEVQINANPKDKIFAGIDVVNSYDMTRWFGAFFLEWREVCSNGLMALSQTSAIQSIHKGIIKERVEQMFFNALDHVEKFGERVERYNVLISSVQSRFNWEDRLIDVAKKSGIPKEKFHDEAKTIVRTESANYYGGVVNDFLIYNALNQIIHNDELNKKDYNVRINMDQKVFQNLLQTV